VETEQKDPGRRTPRPGRTAAWLAKQVELGLADSGLSMPQYRVLGLLDAAPTVSSALARSLAVRPPSITGVVDGLVTRGLVARTNDEGDRRCVSLDVTAEGRRVLRLADDAVDQRLVSLAGCLRTDEADRAVADLSLWSSAMAAHRDARTGTTVAAGTDRR
jgi:DNA-binding MarR family transcriptional regulator